MDKATWKKIERVWAERLGGIRVPVTGRGRGSAPDVEHPRWSVEVKAGKVMSSRMQTAVEQAVASAKGTEKIPLVCITQTDGTRGAVNQHYILMRWEDFDTMTSEHEVVASQLETNATLLVDLMKEKYVTRPSTRTLPRSIVKKLNDLPSGPEREATKEE